MNSLGEAFLVEHEGVPRFIEIRKEKVFLNKFTIFVQNFDLINS